MPASPVSVPHLLALAHGRGCAGPARCCYCGAPAAEPHAPPDSFTAHDALAAPGSGYRCAGCALAMTATRGQSPEGKPWMWSWSLTAAGAGRLALCPMLGGERVRRDRPRLRALALDPPPPPSALVLCQSGRTHTLYRAAVWRGGPLLTLTHDGRRVDYTAADLRDRLALCGRVCAAFGPKVARGLLPVAAGRWAAANLDDLERWHALLDEPLLAAAACLFDAPQPPSPEAQ